MLVMRVMGIVIMIMMAMVMIALIMFRMTFRMILAITVTEHADANDVDGGVDFDTVADVVMLACC